MRGHTSGFGSADALVRTLLEEFPELDATRLRAAVDRAIARAVSASLDSEGYQVVDLHLARVEATEESSERAQILRELSETLEQRGDADRALVVRLSAFAEASTPADLDALIRLARVTERWSELPLDAMNGLVDIHDDDSARRLTELATAWQAVGRTYYAADCLERVLLVSPADPHANEALELFYRSTGEWPALIDLLGRRGVHVKSDQDRGELFRDIAVIYERELDDADAALDAFREADRLAADHPDVLDGIARLVIRVGDSDGEALTALERLARVTIDRLARARVLARAADIAKLHDWNKAQILYGRARNDDPDLAPAVDGWVALLRDRGQLSETIALLTSAAERPALASERSRWLADAGDYCVALGDTDRAKQHYRDARLADPSNHKAGIALVELCWEQGALVELAPILDELCRITVDPGRLRGYLLKRSKVAADLGDATGARKALTLAVDLDPDDSGSRRDLADMLWQVGAWAKARPLLEGLLEHADLLSAAASAELHYRAARCAHELGDKEAAIKYSAVTHALAPDHRDALLLRAELDADDPFALAADQLALANMAPAEEKASRFAALGDRYAELGDRPTAREMYREALSHRPGDHPLLTKFLGLVAEDGDWSYSLDVVRRLIDTEQDLTVRARYRHLGGMIARDELDDPDTAIAMFEQAIEDDPTSFAAADELETLLVKALPPDALMGFYYRRLEQLRSTEGRPGEQLRLWDRLAELCLQLGRNDDALAALEVGMTLDPDGAARRIRLAELSMEAGGKHDEAAIVRHQAVLRADKRRVESYKALFSLYQRTDQPEKAEACDDALSVLRSHLVDERIEALFERGAALPATHRRGAHARALGGDDWLALSRIDIDLQLSALFALVAPPFAVERARMRPPPAVPQVEPELPPQIARVLANVVAAFGIARPAIYPDRDQLDACKVTMRTRAGVLVPVLLLGRRAFDNMLDDELAFLLSRQLSDLRSDRIARLLCPRAGELAQILELASAPPTDSASHAGRWLATSLHPVELAQAQAIGARIRERGLHPMSAAVDWLAATGRAADRIGLVVVGDLATCVRVLEREPAGDADRVVELVWSSVTEELLGVRARVEGWR